MNASFTFAAHQVWHIAGWTMLHYLWLGALVGAMAIIARMSLRRAAPTARYATALTCLFLLAALPLGIAAWLLSNPPPFEGGVRGGFVERVASVDHNSSAKSDQQDIIDLRNQPDSIPLANLQTEIKTETAATPNPEPSPGPSLIGRGISFVALETWIPYLPWVWLVGTPITFALLAAGFIGTKRLRSASRVTDDPRIADALSRLSSSLRIGVRISIAICDRIASPVLVGIVRPIILLPPAALSGWSPDEIEMVLLHELAHVRRWDNLVNLIQRLIESLFFFHPAVWFVSTWVRRERETCCDAFVVHRTERPHAYAELLLNLATASPQPLAGLAFAQHPLRTRIRRILQLDDDPMLISGKSLAVMLSGLFIAATLAVLYLPTIGRAEESTTEVTESTETTRESKLNSSADGSLPQPVLIPFEFVLKRNDRGQLRLYMNDQPVADDVVRHTMARQGKFLSKVKVSFTAEPGIDRSEVKRVLDLLHALGVEKVSVHSSTDGTTQSIKGDASDSRYAGGPSADKPASTGDAATSHPKFPTLEEQKLADQVWKRLGLEMEPIGGDDLQRVKALGYDGGLRVCGRPGNVVRIAADQAGEGIVTGDILVGLHVWPTTSLKAVVAILDRDDLAELNPLKFYVVRQVWATGAKDPASPAGDFVRTGRVSISPLTPPSSASPYWYSNTPRKKAPAEPQESPKTDQASTFEGSNPFQKPAASPSTPPIPDVPSHEPLPPEKEDVLAPPSRRAASRTKNTSSGSKSNLRYDGKTFDDWRNAWQTELSTRKRLEAVKAIAAFGPRGYGREAAESILEVAGEYQDWSRSNDGNLETQLREAVVDGLAEHIPASAWLSPLRQRFDTNPKRWQWLAVRTLRGLKPANDDEKNEAQSFLLALTQSDVDAISSYAVSALVKLDPALRNERIKKLVLERLNSDNPDVVQGIMSDLVTTPQFPPETIDLLLHGDLKRQQLLRNCFDRNTEWKANLALADSMTALLLDETKAAGHLAAIRTLAAMGQVANKAKSDPVDVLQSIVTQVNAEHQIAAAHAIGQITNGHIGAAPLLTGRLLNSDGVALDAFAIQTLLESERKAIFGDKRQ